MQFNALDVQSILPSCNSTHWMCKAAQPLRTLAQRLVCSAQRLRTLRRRNFRSRNGCAGFPNGCAEHFARVQFNARSARLRNSCARLSSGWLLCATVADATQTDFWPCNGCARLPTAALSSLPSCNSTQGSARLRNGRGRSADRFPFAQRLRQLPDGCGSLHSRYGRREPSLEEATVQDSTAHAARLYAAAPKMSRRSWNIVRACLDRKGPRRVRELQQQPDSQTQKPLASCSRSAYRPVGPDGAGSSRGVFGAPHKGSLAAFAARARSVATDEEPGGMATEPIRVGVTRDRIGEVLGAAQPVVTGDPALDEGTTAQGSWA